LPPSKGVFGFEKDEHGNLIDPVKPIIKKEDKDGKPIDPKHIVLDPDDPFVLGMQKRSDVLRDLGKNAVENWVEPFKSNNEKGIPIHGVIKIASDETEDVEKTTIEIINKATENGIIVLGLQKGTQIVNEEGKGIEHFGFRDGVSQPRFKFIDDFSDNRVFEVDEQPPKSFILFDLDGDLKWANDGSFMVFRRLRQDVKAFWKFMEDNANGLGLTTEALAAKFVGRWKSGAPLALFPTNDPQSPESSENNDFTYFDEVNENVSKDKQKIEPGLRAPRFAHIRKVYPRSDGFATDDNTLTGNPLPETNDPVNDTHRILRRGSPYGPTREGHKNEEKEKPIDRGLLFICFQRDLDQQFEFIQQNWANNPQFPRGNPIPPDGHGVDAIIGKVPGERFVNLLEKIDDDGKNPVFKRIKPTEGFEEWVTTTGGEYFFSPSLPALQNW